MSNKKSNKIIFIVIFFATIISIGIYIGIKLYKPITINISEPTKESKTFEYQKETYFVPIVGIESFIDNLDSSIKQEILITKIDQEFINKLSLNNLNFVVLNNYDELAKELNTNPNKIGIINFSSIKFNTKLISFDNLNILDKKIQNYPLVLQETLISKVETKNISNFSDTKLTTIGHTGAMIFARGAMYEAKTKYNNDYTKFFEGTKPLFDKFDFTSGTLEAPIMGRGRECDTCTVFVGDERAIEGIKYSGIDLVSLASNHIMDGGFEALNHSKKLMDNINVKYVGASDINNDEASKPILVEVNGLKIAYLAFNDTPGKNQWADDTSGGAAAISDWELSSTGSTIKYEPNEEKIKYYLKRAKDLNPDLVIVLMHWGSEEYTPKPTEYTRKLAQLLTQNGADAILGDHPHWVQEAEILNGKPVFYSVGNYIFDQSWSERTMEGITIELNIYDKKIINFEIHPHHFTPTKRAAPVVLTKDKALYKKILKDIWDVSSFE